jgi:hypothetical protein
LIPQANITLNLLRPCRQNPALSAHAAIHGSYAFEVTPMAPPGTKAFIHIKPHKRASWGFHAEDAWYVGPAMKHFRCYTVVMKNTTAQRISDTVRFEHHNVQIPHITPAQRIEKATNELTAAVRNAPTDAPPDYLDAIQRLRAVLLKEKTPDRKLQPTSKKQEISQNGNQNTLPTTTSIIPSNSPALIPYENDEIEPMINEEETIIAPRTKYNLRNRKVNIINSAIIDESPNVQSSLHEPKHIGKYGEALKFLISNEANNSALHSPTGLFAGAIVDPETGKQLEYRDLIKNAKYEKTWIQAFIKELDQLAQGKCGVKGTNTIFFIHKSKVPKGRKVTYGRIVVDYRPHKADPNRARLTVGGDRIEYPYDVSTPTADLITSKLLFNSVISTEGSRFLTADIKNFYLNTPMERFEYMRLRYDILPKEIIEKYEIDKIKTEDGWIYIEIQKGMYGLPQAGILANKLLTKRLALHGYYPCTYTPGLWRHKWRPVTFALVVDDFGVKIKGREHGEHLINALEEHYEVTVDWTGSLFCGIHLNWQYNKKQVDIAMPNYIEKALTKYGHKKPRRPQHAPHKHTPIQYGAKVQMVQVNNSPPLNAKQTKRVQDIVGTLLYYGRAVDPTLVTALSSIASQQANATEATLQACNQLLDYVATHPNATIRYLASDMRLVVHSDASYLSESKARSRAAGHFYLANQSNEDLNNGAILTLSTIIRHVVASAAEAELAALFFNAREAVPL